MIGVGFTVGLTILPNVVIVGVGVFVAPGMCVGVTVGVLVGVGACVAVGVGVSVRADAVRTKFENAVETSLVLSHVPSLNVRREAYPSPL